jgi:adenylylsulfate kinase-like enzyme
MDCPLEVLIGRDPKGLYKKALAGEILHFTGINDPYEAPPSPELTIHSDRETPEEGLERLWSTLLHRRLISSD